MSALQRYNKALCDALDLDQSQLGSELRLGSVPTWDSVGHMMLIAELESEFDIEIAPEDIIAFGSYDDGKRILREQYQVEL